VAAEGPLSRGARAAAAATGAGRTKFGRASLCCRFCASNGRRRTFNWMFLFPQPPIARELNAQARAHKLPVSPFVRAAARDGADFRPAAARDGWSTEI
jgi:hypothetical protein